MIRKLRIKLTAVSMLTLFVVLAVIIAGVNLYNYKRIVEDADSTLAILADNGGVFPDVASGAIISDSGAGDEKDEMVPPPTPEDSTGVGEDGTVPPPIPGEHDSGQTSEDIPGGTQPSPDEEGGQGPGRNFRDDEMRLNAELPFESRFFSVLLDADGNTLETNLERIAAIDQSSASEYAAAVGSESRRKGFYDQYRFVKVDEGENTRVIFLDCARNLNTARVFLLASLVIALAGFLVVFLIVALLSQKIVKPVSDSYEKQRRFITDAGHELKTPLTIIDADAEVLEMDIGENEWLSDIRVQTKRLGDLTRDLIYLSKMEEGSRNLTMIEFPLSDVARELADSFRAPAQMQNKTYTVHVADGISCTGDEKSVRQLISILLDNALKYSPEGGEVSLEMKKDGKYALLKVTNTTNVTLPEDTNLLFERFYRADSSRNSETGGYGIGLSVAQAVVQAHRGKIQALRTENGSLTISVSLPV